LSVLPVQNRDFQTGIEAEERKPARHHLGGDREMIVWRLFRLLFL